MTADLVCKLEAILYTFAQCHTCHVVTAKQHSVQTSTAQPLHSDSRRQFSTMLRGTCCACMLPCCCMKHAANQNPASANCNLLLTCFALSSVSKCPTLNCGMARGHTLTPTTRGFGASGLSSMVRKSLSTCSTSSSWLACKCRCHQSRQGESAAHTAHSLNKHMYSNPIALAIGQLIKSKHYEQRLPVVLPGDWKQHENSMKTALETARKQGCKQCDAGCCQQSAALINVTCCSIASCTASTVTCCTPLLVAPPM